MTVTGSGKQRMDLAVRMVLLAAGIALLVLWAAFPQTQGEAVKWNDDNLKTETIASGDEVVQPLSVAAGFDQLSLRVEAVRESKELTLNVRLRSGDSVVAEEAFPLKKVKAKGKLAMEFPAQPAGDYVLEVKASGTGSTKLGGGESCAMQLNGQEMSVGCAVRLNCVVTEYNQALLFSAVLLALLALTPGGKKEAKHNA